MHSMYEDDEVVSHFPKMGTDLPFQNVSGSVPMVGNTIKQNRDPGGRFKPRRPTLVRGLGKPGEDRGSNAVLFREDDGPVHHISPDYSRGVDHSGAHKRNQGNHDFVNHVMDCPSCAVNGFVVDHG